MESDSSTWDAGPEARNDADRPTYTPDQMTRYYEHIGLPQKYRRLDGYVGRTPHGLPFLRALQKYQLAAVPFENLALHYSAHHRVSLDPQHLYHKIVGRKMGGYCMENNCFFATVLRSLEFDLYTVGARVNTAVMPGNESHGQQAPKFSGWSHMVSIVTISGQRYMVDVGFGSNEPIGPLPLIDGISRPHISPQSVRLTHATIPQLTDSTQKLWRYQHRHDDGAPWVDAYCFAELEFLPEDYAVMNYSTSTSRTSWFTQKVICLKMLLDESNDTDEPLIVGRLTLFEDELKWSIPGKPSRVEKLRSEQARLAALRDHFGVNLTDEERTGIRGTMAELKG